ncbi:MAG: hypothetical protein IPM35_02515 [Myxococcales bacterium]|nr:hypothetical protein [Myxococcales bacterium]
MGRLAVVEVLPADEQPQPVAAGADPLSTGRDAAGKLRTSEAARAMARLPRRSKHVPRKLACDPRFSPHNHRRLEWLRGRTSEHQRAHGGVSRGVGAMLASAAWLYAGGEFAAELGAERGDVSLFEVAARLTAQARSHELGAWELGAREAVARRASEQAAKLREALAPRPSAAMAVGEDDGEDGDEDGDDDGDDD